MAIQKNHTVEFTFNGLIILQLDEINNEVDAYLVKDSNHDPVVTITETILASGSQNLIPVPSIEDLQIYLKDARGGVKHSDADLHLPARGFPGDNGADCQAFGWMLDLTGQHNDSPIRKDGIVGQISIKSGRSYSDRLSKAYGYTLGRVGQNIQLGRRALGMAHFIDVANQETLVIDFGTGDVKEIVVDGTKQIKIDVSNICRQEKVVDFQCLYTALSLQPGDRPLDFQAALLVGDTPEHGRDCPNTTSVDLAPHIFDTEKFPCIVVG